MKLPRSLPTTAAAILLAACLTAFYATRDTGTHRVTRSPAAKPQTPLVDNSYLQAARQLAASADTVEEQEDAREALRLTDHELDQAFATALRQAESAPVPKSGPLRDLTNRVAQLKAQVAADKSRVAQLSAAASKQDSAGDELELLKAQEDLDEDQLEDAQQDLTRQGGDRHGAIEQALQEHEASTHQAPPAFRNAAPPSGLTLLQEAQLWLDLNARDAQVLAARRQAQAHADGLLREHQALDSQAGTASAGPTPADTAKAVARLRRLSDQTKTLAEYDKRIEDSKQLADAYGRWSTEVEARRSGALHQLLGSLATILAIVLVVALMDRGLKQAFRQTDRRRVHQLRSMARLAVQVTGVGLVLLILFGPPTQLSTIIGLTTAGLTVALKDFIVGFCGWFVLLGRNGVHVGDWVEIEGVSGEVIEIGLLKTTLLEIGNWAASGHPTGRRVAFMNSYAIEGHFFNFSTAGQWLWDELQVTLPAGGDVYRIGEQIADVVGRQTETESQQAEEEWRRVTAQYGVREFSAKPAVDLRPGAGGLDVTIRYITRAPQRYEVKSRLLQLIVGLLHQPAAARSGQLT